MKNIKRNIILIIMAIIIGITSETFAFDIVPNLENIDLESRKINVLLDVSDLSKYENGINVVSGKLVYDTNIFEEVSLNGTNGWTSAYNDNQSSEGFGKFMLITTSGNTKKDQEIAQISLTVKDNVNNIRTKIRLESLETSYNSDTIKAKDRELQLDITQKGIELSEEIKENLSKSVEKDEKTNYNMYVLILCIVSILIMLLIFIIKFKRKGGRNND